LIERLYRLKSCLRGTLLPPVENPGEMVMDAPRLLQERLIKSVPQNELSLYSSNPRLDTVQGDRALPLSRLMQCPELFPTSVPYSQCSQVTKNLHDLYQARRHLEAAVIKLGNTVLAASLLLVLYYQYCCADSALKRFVQSRTAVFGF
jgi:hypothetical protein